MLDQLKKTVLTVLIATTASAAAMADNQQKIQVDPVQYKEILKALDPRLSMNDAPNTDAVLATQREKFRLDDVYAGFSYLYNSEVHELANPRDPAKRPIYVDPLSPEEEFRVKKFIDQVALASNRHLLQQYPETEEMRELLQDSSLVTAIEKLQETAVSGRTPDAARIRGQIISTALLGGIAHERPSDLIVLDHFFKYLRQDIADPLQEILNENRKEVTIGKFTGEIGKDFRAIEVNLPEKLIKKWKAMNFTTQAGWMGITAAWTVHGLVAWYLHDPHNFAKSSAGATEKIGLFWMSHPATGNPYGRSVLEEYILGVRLWARDFRDMLEKSVPGISKLPFIPTSEPNPLVKRHGYVKWYCRDLFVR